MINETDIQKMNKELNSQIPEALKKKFVSFGGNEFAVVPILMSDLTKFIIHKIGPESYRLKIEDILFLNNVNAYWNGKKDKESCEEAVTDYLKNKIDSELIDPYELVVDACN